MNKTEVINKIKVLLGMEENIVEVKMTEAKLKDGTAVVFDKLEAGSNFLLRQDANTTTPAPAGDYELEDGTVITVGPDNLITNITAPVAAADITIQPTPETTPIVPEAETPAETTAENGIEEVSVDSLAARIALLEQAMTECQDMMLNMATNYSAMKTELSSQVAELSKLPSAEPIHFSKTVESKEPKSIGEMRIEALEKLSTK